MAASHSSNSVYSATYSNVPVYEFNTEGHHVMRRRHDDWINATQILKVAGYDKPSRTRILEKEVQKDRHEKVQGGYGKYQGTWVPIEMARELAERYNVIHKLLPLFDYIPGDVSPPPAPKHTTNKPKVPKPAGPKKAPKPKPMPAAPKMRPDWNANMLPPHHPEESFENSTVASESFLDEDEAYQTLPQKSGPQKRKREAEIDSIHQIYGDSLLDYFIVVGNDKSAPGLAPPQMPDGFQVDRPIDNQEHTSLHWAASMGDLDMVKYFIDFGANKQARNLRGETPLIRAIIFTNSYEKDIMPKMVNLLQDTFLVRDDYGGTVFHHAAALTLSHTKKKAARYYLNILLNMFGETASQEEFHRFLNMQDHNGDTALHIVARNNAKRCVRALQGHGVSGDISNRQHETADQILQLSHQNHQYELGSSSPIQPISSLSNGLGSVLFKPSGLPSSSHYETQPARSFTESFATLIPDKSLQVMLALEQGVLEKDEDLAEANRLVRSLNTEREKIHQETMDLLDRSKESEDDDDALAEEEAILLRENESLFEQIQHRTLHQEIRAEENRLPPLSHQNPSPPSLTNGEITNTTNNNNTTTTDAHNHNHNHTQDHDQSSLLLEAKYHAAHRLAHSQQERRAAVAACVHAMATAGMTEKGEMYKKVVVKTLGLDADEVTNVIPEMLEMFELAKLDAEAEEFSAREPHVVIELED